MMPGPPVSAPWAVPGAAQTVILVTRERTGRDRGGDDVFAETETPVAGCSVQPVESAEALGSGDRITSRLRAFLPPLGVSGVDLTAIDAVRVDGQSYEVDGDPAYWPGPLGGTHHVELYLRKATG